MYMGFHHDLNAFSLFLQILLQERHSGESGRPQTRLQVRKELDRMEDRGDGILKTWRKRVTITRRDFELVINEERQILSLETNSFQRESFHRNCKPVFWLK